MHLFASLPQFKCYGLVSEVNKFRGFRGMYFVNSLQVSMEGTQYPEPNIPLLLEIIVCWRMHLRYIKILSCIDKCWFYHTFICFSWEFWTFAHSRQGLQEIYLDTLYIFLTWATIWWENNILRFRTLPNCPLLRKITLVHDMLTNYLNKFCSMHLRLNSQLLILARKDL